MKRTRFSVPVIIRYAIAVIGAASITIALLLFMNNLVGRFLLRDPTQYFAITNYFPAPDRGRQLPDAPASPAVAPVAPELDYERTEDVVVEIPVVEVDSTMPLAEQPPNLED
jgi:hypothetical protein